MTTHKSHDQSHDKSHGKSHEPDRQCNIYSGATHAGNAALKDTRYGEHTQGFTKCSTGIYISVYLIASFPSSHHVGDAKLGKGQATQTEP